MFESLRPFIDKEKEDGYILNIWEPLLSKVSNLGNKDKKGVESFEQFLSKMMEFERICVEPNDQRPLVWMDKSLQACIITLIKENGEEWRYTLNPFGYNEMWELFKLEKKKISS